MDDQQAFRQALERGDEHAINHAVAYYPRSLSPPEARIVELEAEYDKLQAEYDKLQAEYDKCREELFQARQQVERLTEWNQNAQSLNGMLELRAERLEQLRSNTLEYAWDCRRNGYRVMALSVITALEGEQG